MGKKITKKEDDSRKYIKPVKIFLTHYFDYLLIVLVVAFLLFNYFYVISPKYERILTRTSEEKTQIDDRLFASKIELGKLLRYKDSYDKIKTKHKEEIAKIDKMIPVIDYPEELYGKIEKYILAPGYLLKSLSVTPEDDVVAQLPEEGVVVDKNDLLADVKKMKIEMEVEGIYTYENLKSFLAYIENSLMIMDVQNFTDGKGEDGVVKLEIISYYKKIQKINDETEIK